MPSESEDPPQPSLSDLKAQLAAEGCSDFRADLQWLDKLTRLKGTSFTHEREVYDMTTAGKLE